MDSKLKNEELLAKICEFDWFKKFFDVKNTEILGRGAFGVVISSFKLENPSEKLALKIIFPQSDSTLSEYTKEVNFMTSLSNHANICEIKDILMNSLEKSVVIIMKPARISLKSLLEKEKSLKPDILLQMLADITNGLKYAHSKSIFHCDIKPANILVFDTKNRQSLKNISEYKAIDVKTVFKLSDWGGGLFNTKSKTTYISRGFSFTPGYVAPKISNQEEKLNMGLCDIYSLGMTLLNCCGHQYDDIKHISNYGKKNRRNMILI